MTKRARRTWVFLVAGLVALLLVGGGVALSSPPTPLTWFVRTCALLGYLCIFSAAFVSAYMRQMVKFFGRPFVKVHHILAVSGLVLATTHPLAAAWNLSWSILIPRASSILDFLRWGGRAAWLLLVVAAVAGLLRNRYRKQWRPIHMLTYLAFFLITVHAMLIGTDMQSIVLKAVAVILALAVVTTLVQKQLQRRKRRKR